MTIGVTVCDKIKTITETSGIVWNDENDMFQFFHQLYKFGLIDAKTLIETESIIIKKMNEKRECY